MKINIPLILATLIALSAAHSVANSIAAETVVVESRKADGTPNLAAWAEAGGKWNASKNKTRATPSSPLVATNISVCFTNRPVPAIRISPVLEAGTTYKVEVTFGTSTSYAASPDLVVAVAADGVSANTIPTNTAAFQGAGANRWNTLGTITPSTNRPSLTFKYVSGTLSRESRWYADAVRFVPEAATASAK